MCTVPGTVSCAASRPVMRTAPHTNLLTPMLIGCGIVVRQLLQMLPVFDRCPVTLCVAAALTVSFVVLPLRAAQPDDGAGVKIIQIPLDVLWQDPGDVAALNMGDGVGGAEGAPVPPFQFIEEDMSASNPKVMVRDARGRKWNVKWGDEARPEVFASRVVWA